MASDTFSWPAQGDAYQTVFQGVVLTRNFLRAKELQIWHPPQGRSPADFGRGIRQNRYQ